MLRDQPAVREEDKGQMSQIELEEPLAVALVDLADGEEVSAELRGRLVEALGGEEGLQRALTEAQASQALAKRLERRAPPPHLVEGVLSPARRRRRAPPLPTSRLYLELWALGFLIITLLIAWLGLNAHLKRHARRLEGELQPVPQAGARAPLP